jgi:hypothetical protein
VGPLAKKLWFSENKKPSTFKSLVVSERGDNNMSAPVTELLPERSSNFKDCRMYAQELPNQDDLVVVRVNKVEDFGAYVTLLEYNNTEGMILSSEVSRKRIRSIHKHLRIGKQDVMQVLRVDKDKGSYIFIHPPPQFQITLPIPSIYFSRIHRFVKKVRH